MKDDAWTIATYFVVVYLLALGAIYLIVSLARAVT